jgi:hypothetical protein
MNILENPTVATTAMILLELQKGRNFKALDARIGEFLEHIEQLVATFFVQNPDDARCACHSGCHWCCGFMTLVFPFEVVRIVEYLNGSLTEGERTSLIQRLEKLDKLTGNLSPKKRAKLKVFCPLLQNGVCIAYPVRPMSCRAYLSTDEKACKRAFYYPSNDWVEACVYVVRLYAGVKEGMAQGFAAFAIDSQPGELISYLRQGFQVADLPEAWLKGRRVFRAEQRK